MRVDEEELSNLGTLQPDKNKDDKLRESLIQGGWQYITFYHKIVAVDHILNTIYSSIPAIPVWMSCELSDQKTNSKMHLLSRVARINRVVMAERAAKNESR